MGSHKLFVGKKIQKLHHRGASATSTLDAPSLPPVPVPNQLLRTVIVGSFENEVSPIDHHQANTTVHDRASDSSVSVVGVLIDGGVGGDGGEGGGGGGGGGGVGVGDTVVSAGIGGNVVAAAAAGGGGGNVVAGGGGGGGNVVVAAAAAGGDDGEDVRIDIPAIDQERNALIAQLKLATKAFWLGFLFDGIVLTFLEVLIEVADLRAKVCLFLIYIVIHSVWNCFLMSTQRELPLPIFLETVAGWVRFYALFLLMILLIMGISASNKETGAILGYATIRYIFSLAIKFIESYMVLSLVREKYVICMDYLKRIEAALATMEGGSH